MPKIGKYSLYSIETGRFGLDGGAMFGIVPKPLWERKIQADSKNRIPLNMRCLLLEGNGRLILIDTGLGDKYNAKFADIFAVDHAYASLPSSLEKQGFSVDDITDVIFTHLHFDHCGGATRRDGEKNVLVFPQAVHHVQHDHWQWALHPNIREKNSFLEENLGPLRDDAQLNAIQGEIEIAPGIEVLTVRGHTEAMQLVKISDEHRTLVYAADLIPTHAHVPLAWNMAYDVNPLHTLKEKEHVLEQCVKQGWDLFLEHDPEVEVISLTSGERGFSIQNARPLTEL